jgi:hypothetical protein
MGLIAESPENSTLAMISVSLKTEITKPSDIPGFWVRKLAAFESEGDQSGPAP